MSLVSQLFSTIVSGLVAAVLVALFDLGFAPRGSWLSALALLGLLAPVSVSVALGMSLVAGGMGWVHRRCLRILDVSRWRWLMELALGAAALLPFAFWLVHKLAQGRQAKRFLGAIPIQIGIALVVSLGAALCVWLAIRWFRAALGDGTHRGRVWTMAFALVIIAFGLFYVDAHAYRRLYTYLHDALFVLYVAISVLAAGLIQLAWRWRALKAIPQRVAVLLAGLFLVSLFATLNVSMEQLRRDPALRFWVVEQTVGASHIASHLLSDDEPETPSFLLSSKTLLTDEDDASVVQGVRTIPGLKGANVVLVTIDALRADHLGSYGYARPTSPNLDKLASQAVRFERAYCPVPLTCYSIPSIHTGDYLRSTLSLLPNAPPTLAEILGAQGYATVAFYNASIFFCDDARATAYGTKRFGFAQAETELRPAAALTDRAISFLTTFAPQSATQSLFMWIHYFDVHEPYERHSQYDFGERDIDRYDSEIRSVDQAFGRLIRAVSTLRKPTILVVTSDHGEEFREHGGNYHGSTLYEEQVRIPLLIAAPGISPRVIRDAVQSVDIVPTVIALTGASVDLDSVRGRSLVPQLLGERDDERSAFAEVHTKKMVVQDGRKLIHDFQTGTSQLYDLNRDPFERHNLIGQEQRRYDELKQLLWSWFERLRRAATNQKRRPEGIELGLLGDRRAVPKLIELLHAEDQPLVDRYEAAKLLGKLKDLRAADALWEACMSDYSALSDEAAIALGELQDARARVALERVIERSDIEVRFRAAVALGRAGSSAATPALIEAIRFGGWDLQNRAAHYIGLVGDERAVGPLIQVSQKLHMRSHAAVALGRIGKRVSDERIVSFLVDLMRNDEHSDVRQRAVAALAFSGNIRAAEPLMEMLSRNDAPPGIPEALTRIGAIGRVIDGVDGRDKATIGDGWERCETSDPLSLDTFNANTWCESVSDRATVRFLVTTPPTKKTILIGLKALKQESGPASLELTINGHRTVKFAATSSWKQVRVDLEDGDLHQGENIVTLSSPQARIAIDYLVLAP